MAPYQHHTRRFPHRPAHRAVSALVAALCTLGLWTSLARAEAPVLDAALAADVEADDDGADRDGGLDELPASDDDASAIAGRRIVRHRTVRTRRPVYRSHHRHTRSHIIVTTGMHHSARDHRPSPAQPRHQDSAVSLGLRFTALSFSDTRLRYETFEGAQLAGVGGYLRGRFDAHWGVEIAADVLGNTDGTYDQVSIPVMAGLMAHLFPESILDVYGVVGAGMFFNRIDYHPAVLGGMTGTTDENFTQFAGQLGTGFALNLGALELIADVRWLLVQPRPERAADSRAAVPFGATDGAADELTQAVQLMVGVGGKF